MKAFQQTQLAFIDHLKDPEHNGFDHGIEDRRLQIYRDLFFNNVKGFLSSGFPVLESIYSEQDWQRLARDFFAQHECRSPYFIDISKEFVEFLSNEYQPLDSDPAFLGELAHYEWLELAMSVKVLDEAQVYWDGESGFSAVAMSDLASLVSYQFPVHQISQEFQPQEAGESVFLVVYRNDLDQVNFTLMNPVSAHMVNLIQQHGAVAVEPLVENLCQAMPQIPSEQVRAGAIETLEQLLEQQILLPVTD